ncbi:MAG TPA: hypothetical protein VGN23_05790 [Verrucomicrobiae bacterium]|jgi:hypothetical protein
MKIRKNLTLSEKAIAVGEKLAALHGTSLSALVEKQILASRTELETEHYWPKVGRPIPRPGDARYEYLRKKHA